MLFCRHKPGRLHPVDSLDSLAGPDHRAPKTLEEILAASTQSPVRGKGSHSSSSSRSSYSSERHPEFERQRAPRSRKTGYATIRTDATDKYAAFESDAFAVHMPTTRIPIMNDAGGPARPSPAAQAEAYRTYMEKARQARENSQRVRVPSKLVSYSHTSPKAANLTMSEVKTVEQITNSPSPAGSFPVSPPIPQHGWSVPEQQHRGLVQGPRAMNNSSKPQISCKPTAVEKHAAIPNARSRYRADSVAGASCTVASPTQPTATIKVRLIPKLTMQEIDRVQTESRYSLYTRSSPPSSSTESSRSSSPSKPMPSFTNRDSLEGDSIFGYRVKDITGTVAGASSTSGSDREKEKNSHAAKEKKISTRRSPTSRWAWLKSSIPRTAKTNVLKTTTDGTTYRDPFVTHNTPLPTPTIFRSPVVSRAASLKKLSRPTPTISTGKFDTGFAQIKCLGFLLFKIAFSLYAVIVLWFVLDAVRQAFYTLSAPFQVLKFLGGTAWIWISWLFTMLIRMWEKWGFKVALKGGWMWKMKW